jgi:hypothetical protein
VTHFLEFLATGSSFENFTKHGMGGTSPPWYGPKYRTSIPRVLLRQYEVQYYQIFQGSRRKSEATRMRGLTFWFENKLVTKVYPRHPWDESRGVDIRAIQKQSAQTKHV